MVASGLDLRKVIDRQSPLARVQDIEPQYQSRLPASRQACRIRSDGAGRVGGTSPPQGTDASSLSHGIAHYRLSTACPRLLRRTGPGGGVPDDGHFGRSDPSAKITKMPSRETSRRSINDRTIRTPLWRRRSAQLAACRHQDPHGRRREWCIYSRQPEYTPMRSITDYAYRQFGTPEFYRTKANTATTSTTTLSDSMDAKNVLRDMETSLQSGERLSGAVPDDTGSSGDRSLYRTGPTCFSSSLAASLTFV